MKQNQVEFRIDEEGGPSLMLVTNRSTSQEQGAEAGQSRGRGSRGSTHEDEAEASGSHTVITSLSFNEWKQIIDTYGLAGKSIINRLGGKN